MDFYLDGMREEYSRELTDSVKQDTNVYTVGWRPDSHMWQYDFFKERNCNITLIEIFEPNANAFPKEEYNATVVCDSVENFAQYVNKEEKDKNILYWSDGPEHLEMDASKKLLEEAKEYFSLIIIQTPNGVYEQGEMYGNIHESHLSSWYESDYEELGFELDKTHGPAHNFDALIGFWIG